MFKKNKKGISPLIATVLVIGFTIVLAALVITWGTKLFKTTVSETETTSKFSLACTTGLRLEVLNSDLVGNKLTVTLRNNNQDRKISDFRAVVINGDGTRTESAINATGGATNELAFPVPKSYEIIPAAGVTGADIYPIFTIEGTTKACESPTEVRL